MRRSVFSLLLVLTLVTTASAVQVTVVEDAPWSPDDASRDGAAELAVLLRLAELQQQESKVGLVGVADRRGIFQDGTQRGLEFAVWQGVPVVRLARGVNTISPHESDLFINGGLLSPTAAAALLKECLERYGALPKSRSPGAPSAREAALLRAKLRLYQAEFTSRQPALVAMR